MEGPELALTAEALGEAERLLETGERNVSGNPEAATGYAVEALSPLRKAVPYQSPEMQKELYNDLASVESTALELQDDASVEPDEVAPVIRSLQEIREKAARVISQ